MTEARPYFFSPDLKVWVTPTHDGIAYSDGDVVEHRLLKVLRACLDVSAASEELRAHITDWPTEYHLSTVRHNLLRPFTFGPADHILEIGCGCGAITRYLGETGAKVVAVEGSRRRAAIAAERCRDLPNVTVYCDNLVDFQTNEDFNFVTLIGVLEYSQQFITGPDPVRDCLQKARNFLSEDGTLVLAIENQLGLKYFNGCIEDHTGIPYFGINGLYGKVDPVTLGRHALAEKLSQSGFPNQNFFYPFPDYKLPGLILSESALSDARLNVADLLIHNTGRDYPESHHRVFAEDLAWRVATENRLLPDLANSFLVFSRSKSPKSTPKDWLAKIYSRGHRRPHYQVESTLVAGAGEDLAVLKQKLFPESHADGEWLRHAVTGSTYIPGNLLVGKIHKAMAREAGINELASCFKPWLHFLLSHATNNIGNGQLLPGHFIDCIPANLIERPDGKLQYFDAEWVCKEPIPMVWTVIRGIVYSLIDCLDNEAIKHMTYRQFIAAIAKQSDVHLSDADFVVADIWEAKMVAQCHMDASTTPRLAAFFDTPLFLLLRLSGNVLVLRRHLAWHEAELARVKRTISWRITAPLRVVWNMYQRLVCKRDERVANAS